MDLDVARQRLLAERERLSGMLAGLDAELTDSQQDQLDALSSYDQHPADQGSETFEREKDLSIRDSLVAEIDEIDAALARVDAGTYAIDEETGEPIAPERLEAIPYARTNVRS